MLERAPATAVTGTRHDESGGGLSLGKRDFDGSSDVFRSIDNPTI